MATSSTAITRLDLGSTFAEFDTRMNRMGFIGTKVLRPRIVGMNAADAGKIPLKQLLQSTSESTARSAGAGYKRDTFEFDKYSYSVQEYGKEDVLDDGQKAIYRDLFDAEDIASERATDAVLGEYERDVASTVFNASTWTGSSLSTAIVNEWDDFTNATPIADVSAAIEKVAAGSGLEANALIMNRKVLRNLLQCDEIVDRIKYTQTPTVQLIRNALADLLDVKYILVAGGFKNTADKGQEAAISRIWSDEYVMVAKVAETDDPREPCLGRTFMWSGDGPSAPGDDAQLAVILEEYREEGVRGTVFRARNNRDIVVMYAQAAHLLSNATT